jgi:Zn-dependent peptidase ImmA (M78 family)
LKLDDCLLVEINDLVGAPFPVIEAAKPPVSSFEGIVGVGRSSICCFTAKRHPNAKRFVCVRGLLGFLFDKKTTPEFYSSAIDNSQQRSRAFAAEFLAPASLIAPRLSGDDISVEEIEELASDFDVSPFVIEHQIRNHKLAKMIV